ncbi:hypothetical protein BFP97_15215 [Roseivirga sp. 4D4]|nr:hypothetical protein BFP97_15215 [Roseivirga sp. 4D4]
MFLGSTVLSAITVFILLNHQPQEVAFMAGVFVLSALLWVTEALPLFATALLAIGLQIILLANPGEWLGVGFESGNNPDFREILSPFADPILILFLGGFILARAAVKEGVDRALASSILKVFGNKPGMVLLGLMLITAVFSMFMSNTATTAMMITLVSPLIINMPTGDPLRKGLVLCIPCAANIGGMGTPIGSPPNAVAIGFLRNEGIEVDFLSWMIIGVPLVLILLFLSWLVISRLYKSPTKGLQLKADSQRIQPRGWFVILVFSSTILLWLTDQWHGLPSAVTALLPVVIFTATSIIDRKDYNSLEWHILALIAGGIALGLGMKLSGLDKELVALIPATSSFVFVLLVLATVLLSIFMSNTAAANLIIPLGISLATMATGGPDHQVVYYGLSIALASSAAMALPISTPPNAIAYAKGIVETKDFVKIGGFVSLMAVLLIGLLGPQIIGFWLDFLG